MQNIPVQLKEIKDQLPNHVTLVAVSKTQPVTEIIQAYDAGQLAVRENKDPELAQNAEEMPKDIRWHKIGHLQRNKVKYIAPFVHLIHGVDSLRLLKEINKQAIKAERVIKCLLQVHIAAEETKFGFNEEELDQMMNDTEFQALDHVEIVGLMGMATFTEDAAQVRSEFASLKSLFEKLGPSDHARVHMNTLSMGMSGDYSIAIDEGSTMVRIGSSIFGARN